MRVFVAGASGAIGRPLVPRLVAAGHEVTGTTRSEQRAEAIRAAGAERRGRRRARRRRAAARPCRDAAPEVVVHELTALPDRFDPRDPDLYDADQPASAATARATCSTAARAAGARRFVCQSIAFAYAPGAAARGHGRGRAAEPGAPRRRSAHGVRVIEEMERAVLRRRGARRPGAALRLVLRPGHLLRRGRQHRRGGAQAPLPGDRAAAPACSRSSTSTTRPRRRWRRSSAAPRASTTSSTTSPPPCATGCPPTPRAIGAPAPAADAGLAGAAGGRARWSATMNVQPGASNAKAKRELGWEPRWPSWREGFRAAPR